MQIETCGATTCLQCVAKDTLEVETVCTKQGNPRHNNVLSMTLQAEDKHNNSAGNSGQTPASMMFYKKDDWQVPS
jgi:hypothetical protein